MHGEQADEWDDAEMAETLADWPTAPKTIDALREIVSTFGARMVDGVMVDVQSANAIVTVWDALTTDKGRETFGALPIERMGHVAWKIVNRRAEVAS